VSTSAPKKKIDQPQLAEVELRLIRQSPHQHRVALSGKPLDAPFSELPPAVVEGPEGLRGLASSIASVGLICPVRLRPQDDGTFLLIEGECRVRAHHHLGKTTISAMVGGMDEASAALATADGNLKRRGIRPLEEATSYKMIFDACGGSLPAAAKRAGVTPDLFRRRLCLLNLSASWRAASDDIKSPVYGWGAVALETIARMPEPAQEQLWQIARFRLLAKPSGADIEDLCKSVMHRISEAPFDPGLEFLIDGAGACKNCPRRTGADAPLFAEINQKDDHCLDSACWNEKTKAAISQRIKLANAPVYLVSTIGAKAAPGVAGAGDPGIVPAIIPEVALGGSSITEDAFGDPGSDIRFIYLDGPRAGFCGSGQLAQHARDTSGRLLVPERPEEAQAARRARQWLRLWHNAVAAHVGAGSLDHGDDNPAMLIFERLKLLPHYAITALAVSYGAAALPEALAIKGNDLEDYAPAAINPILAELGAVDSKPANFLCGPVRKARNYDFSDMLFGAVMSALYSRLSGYLASRNTPRLGVTEIDALENLISRATPGGPMESWKLLEKGKE
jgi:ParB/RepB/Spo0J family partition protein